MVVEVRGGEATSYGYSQWDGEASRVRAGVAVAQKCDGECRSAHVS